MASSSSTDTILQKFLSAIQITGWRQEGDNEKKAIAGLLRNLNEREKQQLLLAVKYPTTQYPCVFSKNKDKRIQVSYKKHLPHVLSCRIWRWPDLRYDTELKAVFCDRNVSPETQQYICINPFHYKRVESADSLYPAIVVRSESETPPVSVDLKQNPRNDVVCHPAQAGSSQIASSMKQGMEELTGRSWGSISYRELNIKVGEPFECNKAVVKVDGYTNPNRSLGRFCVGHLTNVNRNSRVEWTRRHIMDGLVLTYKERNLYAQRLTKLPVFFESRIHNSLCGLEAKTVCQIPSEHSIKIFDIKEFGRMLEASVVGRDNEAMLVMANNCNIYVSIGDGWGGWYRTTHISSTSCWIEIKLHDPMITVNESMENLNRVST